MTIFLQEFFQMLWSPVELFQCLFRNLNWYWYISNGPIVLLEDSLSSCQNRPREVLFFFNSSLRLQSIIMCTYSFSTHMLPFLWDTNIYLCLHLPPPALARFVPIVWHLINYHWKSVRLSCWCLFWWLHNLTSDHYCLN